MISAQNCKNVVLFNMQTVATNATTSARVDRSGFYYAQFTVAMPPATATNSSAKWTVLKFMEADVTTVSSASNISGFIGTTNSTAVSSGTAVEFVIAANNDTSTEQTSRFNMDLRGRKRYIFCILQANASHQTVRCDANLYRCDQGPNTVAESGCAVWVNR